MTFKNINVESFIEDALSQIESNSTIDPALKITLVTLVTICKFLLQRSQKNSKNSSVPPAADPNRKKKAQASGNRRGGQTNHVGVTLTKVDNPDDTIIIQVDRKEWPGHDWTVKGYERRQVIELDFSRRVVEYCAEILVDKNGFSVTAPFPENVTKAVQYGSNVKSHIVYLSQYQLIPYERIAEHFSDQYEIPVSTGSVYNFLYDAYERLGKFELWLMRGLCQEPVLNVDETGVNIESKRKWLHVVCSPQSTLYKVHDKRGSEATNDIGVLPNSKAIFVHDHWSPYYTYDNEHALCNAHILRDLESAKEDNQKWAERFQEYLLELNKEVEVEGGILPPDTQLIKRDEYDKILAAADSECPAPPPKEPGAGKRGRIAKSKSRNLLERLRDYKDEVLRFTTNILVPFTNNLAENDLRMTKVQQKISGCFRSWQGAHIFCRIRSYLSTCRKRGVTASSAMNLLFEGKLPDFVDLP